MPNFEECCKILDNLKPYYAQRAEWYTEVYDTGLYSHPVLEDLDSMVGETKDKKLFIQYGLHMIFAEDLQGISDPVAYIVGKTEHHDSIIYNLISDKVSEPYLYEQYSSDERSKRMLSMLKTIRRSLMPYYKKRKKWKDKINEMTLEDHGNLDFYYIIVPKDCSDAQWQSYDKHSLLTGAPDDLLLNCDERIMINFGGSVCELDNQTNVNDLIKTVKKRTRALDTAIYKLYNYSCKCSDIDISIPEPPDSKSWLETITDLSSGTCLLSVVLGSMSPAYISALVYSAASLISEFRTQRRFSHLITNGGLSLALLTPLIVSAEVFINPDLLNSVEATREVAKTLVKVTELGLYSSLTHMLFKYQSLSSGLKIPDKIILDENQLESLMLSE